MVYVWRGVVVLWWMWQFVAALGQYHQRVRPPAAACERELMRSVTNS